MTCQYVTERATVGPCAVVIGPGAENSPYAGKLTDCLDEPDHFVHGVREPGNRFTDYRHAYLGPVLARCGHEEGEHEALFNDSDTPGRDWHAFTDVN